MRPEKAIRTALALATKASTNAKECKHAAAQAIALSTRIKTELTITDAMAWDSAKGTARTNAKEISKEIPDFSTILPNWLDNFVELFYLGSTVSTSIVCFQSLSALARALNYTIQV